MIRSRTWRKSVTQPPALRLRLQTNVARVTGGRGSLILSVDTPYDRELLAEQVRAYAGRHGQANVEMNGREWTVTAPVETPRRARPVRPAPISRG